MNNKVVKNVNGQVGEGVGFERIRRITGYLVGTLDRFNNGSTDSTTARELRYRTESSTDCPTTN